MAEPEIPPDVLDLLLERIDSVPHLEALLLLRADPERDWSADGLAKRLYVTGPAAGGLLDDLRRQHFLAVRRDRGLLYRYAPEPPELAELVNRLAETYRQRLIPVTNVLHAKPSLSVKRFGDAFRLG